MQLETFFLISVSNTPPNLENDIYLKYLFSCFQGYLRFLYEPIAIFQMPHSV